MAKKKILVEVSLTLNGLLYNVIQFWVSFEFLIYLNRQLKNGLFYEWLIEDPWTGIVSAAIKKFRKEEF